MLRVVMVDGVDNVEAEKKQSRLHLHVIWNTERI